MKMILSGTSRTTNISFPLLWIPSFSKFERSQLNSFLNKFIQVVVVHSHGGGRSRIRVTYVIDEMKCFFD
jgi:hypothetical protein